MKHFTIEEANDALSRLRPMVERMVGLRRESRRLHEELAHLKGAIEGNGGGLREERLGELEEHAARATSALAQSIDELETQGIQVKDLDRGLVDFPARHPSDGQTVLLCWELGEESVHHWHGTDEGFAGRKRLPF